MPTIEANRTPTTIQSSALNNGFETAIGRVPPADYFATPDRPLVSIVSDYSPCR
jgi:hypothetical protein